MNPPCKVRVPMRFLRIGGRDSPPTYAFSRFGIGFIICFFYLFLFIFYFFCLLLTHRCFASFSLCQHTAVLNSLLYSMLPYQQNHHEYLAS